MFNQLLHKQQYYYLLLFTLLFISHLIPEKVEAKTIPIQGLINSQPTDNQTFANYKSGNNIRCNSINTCTAQNIISEPIQVFPNINDANIPNFFNPILNPDFYNNEPDTTKPTNLNEPQQNFVDTKKKLQLLILNALTNSATRYPWIIDPRYNLNFATSTFNPFKNANYIDFSIKFSAKDPIVERFNFAHFQPAEQFYWVLPNNRIVVETQGWQSGISYQGETTDFQRIQIVRLTQRLWGMQAVSSIPPDFQELVGGTSFNQFSIQSIAAELINPIGIPAPSVQINSPLTANSSQINSIVPNISSLSTNRPPLILQSFPTNNLQPLLGDVSLHRGEIVPQNNLKQAGFIWGNPLTSELTRFQAQTTSIPGIKQGSREQFDNSDLFDILLNPDISNQQRNLSYLNSLFWVTLGQQQTLLRTRDKTENQNWQRFYFSRPHNRTLLQYDSLVNKATYTNIYSNPGVSLSFSLDQIDVDQIQTANTSLGMLLGGVFEFIHPPEIANSLEEAKTRLSRQENFAPINSKATPEQRRKINQLLNRTLFLGNRTSSLEQISGSYTFPGKITPTSSSIFQIRAGNYRRAVQFIRGERTWREGKTYISKIDVSNRSFGRLSSVNVPIPAKQIPISTNNRSSALQVALISPNGESFVQNYNSSDTTTVPVNIRSFDLAFDNIELSQNGRLITHIQTFNGYLSLPAIETLWAGAAGNWNYSINSGIWLNLNSSNAFNITNELGNSEPTLGFYTNGLLNYIDTHIELNAAGQTQAITSHIPALRFHWNSGSNYQNPAYINLSYSLIRQDKDRNNYSLTTGIIFYDATRRLRQSGFFQGAWEFSTGVELKTTVEISENFFYTLEGTQKINDNWYLGTYLQNFRDISRGIRSRVNDFSYGLLIKRDIPSNGMFWESRLGMSGNTFEARFEGGFRF
ncbi:hypothetical protein H6G80_05705 [Nostoc sp. FACHB-87]|uniref:hypothetical protein n=1 Tax=Nostocaceae TaxID=1162 RepID=UPI001687390C|nr:MULTISPECIES: hypothetical protein [Nostocaceae]MBD2453569.1 hypothetical protein [Nostoc sp. FACHB-87]MBD2475694.1 hypothetical protein [Anabaena sp. FACHB-83]